MEELHDTFVLASYGLGALILGGILLWLWVDARLTKRTLEQLEAEGLRRRSEAGNE